MLKIEELITNVSRPARYIGGEMGSIVKNERDVKLYFALTFPEIYEIAMSHLGIKILYQLLNIRGDIAAERVFMPWTDLKSILERKSISPWSLESKKYLNEFDVIGFSMQYELTYSNMLQMLRLSGIPLKRKDRTEEHPLIIAGGPCMANPEPLADFLDLAFIGEVEEEIDSLLDLFIAFKEKGWSKNFLYEEVANLKGVYLPHKFDMKTKKSKMNRTFVKDINKYLPPTNYIVPFVEPVHDRFMVEISRGCTRGCRFCQAGYIYRPVRERDVSVIFDSVMEASLKAGMKEVGLLSLSSGDYSHIAFLLKKLMDELEPKFINLSLPSLRVDTLFDELMLELIRVRKSGITLAPEAGSRRLRNVINKNLSKEDIDKAIELVNKFGWNLIKLYFMIGLPTEKFEDLEKIAVLCKEITKKMKRKGKRKVLHISLGIFVPKPHTPFQWESQVDIKEAKLRLNLVRKSFNDRRIKIKWNLPEQSIFEGIFSRGDRRLSEVLEIGVKKGYSFDGWSERFNFDGWLRILHSVGLSESDYLRSRDLGEVLPWDHIDVGVNKSFLISERNRAFIAEPLSDCRDGNCNNCGVCNYKEKKPQMGIQNYVSKLNGKNEIKKTDEQCSYFFSLQKRGLMRFLGHKEMISQILSALQKVGVRVAYSKGFHPHPLIKTSSPLPLGVESVSEKLKINIFLDNNIFEPMELETRINKILPTGLFLKEGRKGTVGEKIFESKEIVYLIKSSIKLSIEMLSEFKKKDICVFVRNTPKGKKNINLKKSIKDIVLENKELKVTLMNGQNRPKPFEILIQIFRLTLEEALLANVLKI